MTDYEVWLACDCPLLDVHLRAPVDPQLFARGVKAIDEAIEVEQIRESVYRLAIPPRTSRVGMGGEHSDRRELRFGNVKLLHRVFAELVLPLHREVGVERVEMGGLLVQR